MFFMNWVIFGIVTLVINVALVVWVYNDAERKGEDGGLWVAIVLIGGLAGLIAYILVSGGPALPQKPIVLDEDYDERAIRAKYRSGGKEMPDVWKGSPGDPGFSDPELDRLLAEKDFNGARTYLRDMQKIAREMNDAKALANYAKYENKIMRASSAPSDRPFKRRTGAEYDPK
jgi:hypothetical protein